MNLNSSGSNNYNDIYISNIPVMSTNFTQVNSERLIDDFFYNISLPEYAIRALLSCDNIYNTCNFDNIIIRQQVSMNFIRQYYDKFTKSSLYSNYDVDLNFIEEHINDDDIALNEISTFQKLSVNFISKYINILNFDALLFNKNVKLSKYFIVKYIDKIKDYDNLILSPYISDDNFSYILNYIETNREDISKKLNFRTISWNREMNEETIFNHIDDIDFTSLKLSNRHFKDERITCYVYIKYGK